MSRDFILIFSGGMVSLITTLVILFVADYLYRREQLQSKQGEVRLPEPPKPASTHSSANVRSEPAHPPETKMNQVKEDQTT